MHPAVLMAISDFENIYTSIGLVQMSARIDYCVFQW